MMPVAIAALFDCACDAGIVPCRYEMAVKWENSSPENQLRVAARGLKLASMPLTFRQYRAAKILIEKVRGGQKR